MAPDGTAGTSFAPLLATCPQFPVQARSFEVVLVGGVCSTSQVSRLKQKNKKTPPDAISIERGPENSIVHTPPFVIVAV